MRAICSKSVQNKGGTANTYSNGRNFVYILCTTQIYEICVENMST